MAANARVLLPGGEDRTRASKTGLSQGHSALRRTLSPAKRESLHSAISQADRGDAEESRSLRVTVARRPRQAQWPSIQGRRFFLREARRAGLPSLVLGSEGLRWLQLPPEQQDAPLETSGWWRLRSLRVAAMRCRGFMRLRLGAEMIRAAGWSQKRQVDGR
jgi:hypothetical protein